MNNTVTTKTQKIVKTVSLKGINNPEEAMEKMDCGWIAESEELISQTGLSVPSHKCIVRSDNRAILGVVGKDYNPTQFNTYFAQFDTLVQSLKLKYDKGIIYDGGKKVILKAKFPKSILIRVGDKCKSELNWGTSFNGSMGNNGWFTILRLACTNGMTTKSKYQQFRCRHTKNSQIMIEEKMKLLLQSEKYFAEFKEQSKHLANVIADRKMVNDFINSNFAGKKLNPKTKEFERSTQTENQIDKVKELFHGGKGNGQGTAWDLFNGFTEFVDHERGSDKDKRLVSSTVGQGYNIKEKAFTSLLSLTK